MTEKKWHLAESIIEENLALFCLHLTRLFFTYTSYVEILEKKASNNDLKVNDIFVFHCIWRKPLQTSAEILSSLNITDLSTISYSLQKLIKLKLIKKVIIKNKNKKSISYQLTEAGVKYTNAFSKLREEISLPAFSTKSSSELEKIKENLFKMKILYKKLFNEICIHEKELEAKIDL